MYQISACKKKYGLNQSKLNILSTQNYHRLKEYEKHLNFPKNSVYPRIAEKTISRMNIKQKNSEPATSKTLD